MTRAPHTPLRAFPVRKNTQTLAGESSAISLLPHRIPFPRRAHRELPGLRRATHTSLQHAGSLPSHTGTRRRVDRRLRTRQRPQDATPHDPTPRSESPRKNALPRRGVIPSSAANAWSTPRWSRGKPRGLPTQPPPRRASPTGSPFPRNASISEVFPPKNLRYSPRRNRQSRFSPDYDRVSPRQVTLRAPSAHSHASFSYRFEAVTTPHHLRRHHRQTAARLDAAAPHPRHDAPRADRSEGLPPPANSRARTASRPATTHAHRGPSRRVSLPAPRR